jgi:hypothetical protein
MEHHRRRKEAQRRTAQIDDVGGADRLDDEPVVVLGDAAHAGTGGHDASVGTGRHHVTQARVVVGLDVVDHDHVDAGWVDDLRDAGEQLGHERRLHGVDQGDLVGALHQVGVVGRAARRIESVEVAEVPVDGTDPGDMLRNGDSAHGLAPYAMSMVFMGGVYPRAGDGSASTGC